jgi:membrane glycosyltransferase
MTKVIEKTIEQDNPDLILTLDYDSVMTPGHLSRMIQLMMLYPGIDALAPIQSSRHHDTTLFHSSCRRRQQIHRRCRALR